jgi:ubiquinone/menaquinone biosynthesis C-methylase UbiE
MEIELSFQDKKRIEQSKALYYDPELIQALPDTVAASYCGVGNPFTLGPIREGEAVLDIGCGAGVDTILAGEMVGPSGKAVGVDVVPEMLERAIENLNGTSLTNVTFREASAQDLPFADETFDVVISNGVFNLVPDKLRALAEAFRVLKPNGRLTIADQLLTGDLPDDMKPRIESWFR